MKKRKPARLPASVARLLASDAPIQGPEIEQKRRAQADREQFLALSPLETPEQIEKFMALITRGLEATRARHAERQKREGRR